MCLCLLSFPPRSIIAHSKPGIKRWARFHHRCCLRSLCSTTMAFVFKIGSCLNFPLQTTRRTNRSLLHLLIRNEKAMIFKKTWSYSHLHDDWIFNWKLWGGSGSSTAQGQLCYRWLCATGGVSRLLCIFMKDNVCIQSQMVSKMSRINQIDRIRVAFRFINLLPSTLPC